MNHKRIFAAGLFAAAITLSLPALAMAFGEIQHEATAGLPALPPPPQEPTNQRVIIEALTRVRADGRARFVTSLGIVRHRVQSITGLAPNQLAGTALDVSIDRGPTHIASFRAVFDGFLPDADGVFENRNGQNAPFANWEVVRRSENGLLVLDAGGTGTINEAVSGHPGIPNVLAGDIATFKLVKNAGTPTEAVVGTVVLPFD